ncbi:serine/threonine-protein phosphatase 7 long form homolog [Arachis hypogaea]|uniref:serine/threonine-protein phosphatase 7 long form homolog n=1 Tax=Arachis hypogaea TaxID=3818 RepID=UPI003B21F0C4
MRGHSALLNTLVERWRLETHTFHLPVGKVTVTLEDASYILGLPINGEAVTVRSNSCHQFLVENCIACFGRESGPDDHVFEKVNIVWIWQCRDTDPCDTQESLERYVRAHIFCVLGIIVFPEKSTVLLNSKFLPLLRDFHRISRWSHWRRHTRYIRRPTAHFRRGLDDMGVDDGFRMSSLPIWLCAPPSRL